MARRIIGLASVLLVTVLAAGIGTQRLSEHRQERLNQALMRAVSTNDLTAVSTALSQGADPNARTLYRSNTALHLSVHLKKPWLTKTLLRAGAHPNVRDGDGRTPLLVAAQERMWGTVGVLISEGADPNIQDRQGRTPLMAAAEGGDTRAIETFLKHKASIDAADAEGRTALMYAVRTPSYSLRANGAIQLLLDRGSDLHARDHADVSVLRMAAMADHTDAIDTLVARGADIHEVDSQGRTLLLNTLLADHGITAMHLMRLGATIPKDHAQRAIDYAWQRDQEFKGNNAFRSILTELMMREGYRRDTGEARIGRVASR